MANVTWKIARRGNAQLPLVIVTALALVLVLLGKAEPALFDRARAPLSRRLLGRAFEIYAERFSDADGRVRASFEIVTATGWAPHESQQQPLRPGSAKARLADALGVVEHSLG